METTPPHGTVAAVPAFLNFLRGMETQKFAFKKQLDDAFLNFLRGMETAESAALALQALALPKLP